MENTLYSELHVLFYELSACYLWKPAHAYFFFFFFLCRSTGLAYIHPPNEHKPPRSFLKCKPATLKGTLSVKCISTEEVWRLIDLLLLPIRCAFLTMANVAMHLSLLQEFVSWQMSAVLNWTHDTRRGAEKEKKKKRLWLLSWTFSSHYSPMEACESSPSKKKKNPWRTIGLCHPKKAGPFKIITLFLTRESGLLCRPWPHPSPFSWQPQHGNLVKNVGLK